MCMVLVAKIKELKFELIDHPPYWPDLAPSDFFFFPNWKKLFSGQGFILNEEVITHTNTCLEDQPKSYFSDGLKKLEEHLIKCIELQRNYVEK